MTLAPVDPVAGFRLRAAPLSASQARPRALGPLDTRVETLSAPQTSAVLAQMHREAEPSADALRPVRDDSASPSPRTARSDAPEAPAALPGATRSSAVPSSGAKKRSYVSFGPSGGPASPESADASDPEPAAGGPGAKRRKQSARGPSAIESVVSAAAAAASAASPAAPDQCEAISSRQWFANSSRKKRECAVCRFEGRKPTAVTDFCRTHGACLCSRVHPAAAAGPGMCPDTAWTCWMKFHRFYLPNGVFSAKGNMRRSSPLYKLRYAFIQAKGRAGAAPEPDEDEDDEDEDEE